MNNIVLKAAVNRRKMRFLSSFCTFISVMVNMVLSSIMVFLLYNITRIRKSDWHNDNVLYAQSSYDPFFEEKINLIIGILVASAAIIIILSYVLIYMMNKMWLNKLSSQIKIYSLLGYTKKNLHGIAAVEIFADYILSIPFCILLIWVIWKVLCRNGILYNLFRYINGWHQFNYLFFIIIFLSVAVLTELQIIKWVSK